MKMKIENFPDPGKHKDLNVFNSSTMPTYRKQLSFNPYKSIVFKHNGKTHELRFNDLLRANENEELGKGVSSIVIEMVHEESKKSFAVKRVPRRFYELNFDDEQILEPDALEYVKHSQDIIKYYGYFYLESYVWIIMDKMDCCLTTFYQKVKNMGKRVPENVLALIAYKILRAIQFLEKNGIMHRDIKPANVLINRDADIRLCDFGEAGAIRETGECYNKLKGTDRYKAPEKVIDGNHGYTIKSEFWSLGLTLIEVANLARPYEGVPNYALKNAISSQDEPTLIDEHYSKAFSSFLDLCLQKDDSKRADLETLMMHDFILNNNLNETDLEFVRSVIKENQT